VRGLIVIVLAAIMLGEPTFAADKIRIGYSGMTISNALLWVTEEGKLFEKNGIDAEVLYLQTTLGQTALLAGEIQMCVYSAALLAPARVQGADVVMVTSFLSRPLYRLVVKPTSERRPIFEGSVWALRVLGQCPTGRRGCSWRNWGSMPRKMLPWCKSAMCRCSLRR